MVDGLTVPVSVSVTVYDDSTTDAGRASYRAVCAGADLAVRYFGEEDRRALVATAERALRPPPDALATSRPLGSGGWDLAGCRFTAMLNGAMDPRPSSRHLFLDDDLRLVDCQYAGQELAVDTAAIGLHLAGAELPTEGLFAAGVPFRGRADMALLEHLDAVLETMSAGCGVACPDGHRPGSAFPAVITSSPYVHPDSPGFSGGFLLTNRLSLRTVPLFRSFDEDWIWLRQLALAGGTVHRFDEPVVHAGNGLFGLSVPVLLHQFEGEVFDGAWRRCAEAGLPFAAGDRFVEEAFEECARGLDATLARASAVAIGSVVELLCELRAQVRQAPPDLFRDMMRVHVERSRQWELAFAALEPSSAATP